MTCDRRTVAVLVPAMLAVRASGCFVLPQHFHRHGPAPRGRTLFTLRQSDARWPVNIYEIV